MIKELQSGAKLEVQLAPFSDSNNLQKAMARELKGVHITADMNLTDANFLKNIVLSAICSEEISHALEVCMKRCLYNDKRIDKDTFESSEARGDYHQVCFEVAKENLLPFMKGLSSQLEGMFQGMKVPLK